MFPATWNRRVGWHSHYVPRGCVAKTNRSAVVTASGGVGVRIVVTHCDAKSWKVNVHHRMVKKIEETRWDNHETVRRNIMFKSQRPGTGVPDLVRGSRTPSVVENS